MHAACISVWSYKYVEFHTGENRYCQYSYHHFLVQGIRISAVKAMCTEGVVDYHLITGISNDNFIAIKHATLP